MKNIHQFSFVAFIFATLVGCASNVNKQDVGAVLGGVGGGIAGSALSHGNTAATIGGTLGGAYIGSQVAKGVN